MATNKEVEMYRQRMHAVCKSARKHKYTVLTISLPVIMLAKNQEEDYVQLIIDVGEYSAVSIIEHPKQGRTKLKRERLSMDLVKKIIENPRVHTPNRVNTRYLR